MGLFDDENGYGAYVTLHCHWPGCGQSFTERATSDISLEDAEGKAEQAAADARNSHAISAHSGEDEI